RTILCGDGEVRPHVFDAALDRVLLDEPDGPLDAGASRHRVGGRSSAAVATAEAVVAHPVDHAELAGGRSAGTGTDLPCLEERRRHAALRRQERSGQPDDARPDDDHLDVSLTIERWGV